MQRREIKDKSEHIGKAINILEGLKNSLDMEQSPEIAGKLLALYKYIQDILIQANIKNEEKLLIEANTLLAEVHQAWQEIKPGE